MNLSIRVCDDHESMSWQAAACVVKSKRDFGLTLGRAEMLAAGEFLLLVSGANKREPLGKLLLREMTTEFPASFLWLHPNWTLLCDRAAAEGLNLQA